MVESIQKKSPTKKTNKNPRLSAARATHFSFDFLSTKSTRKGVKKKPKHHGVFNDDCELKTLKLGFLDFFKLPWLEHYSLLLPSWIVLWLGPVGLGLDIPFFSGTLIVKYEWWKFVPTLGDAADQVSYFFPWIFYVGTII